jgi:hypothetical protein
MNTITIIYIAIAALVGAAIAYFASTRKAKNDSTSSDVQDFQSASEEALEQAESEIKKLKQLLNEKSNIVSSDRSSTTSDAHYESEIKNLNSVIDGLKSEISTLKSELSNSENKSISASNEDYLNKIELLKKQIEELKDDLGDLKEDKEDLEKYLAKEKQKKEELSKEKSKIEDKLIQKERENKEISYELEASEHKLKKAENELEQDRESFSFVKEVLTAKQVSNKDISQLYTAVDSICDYIKTEFRDCLTSAIEIPAQDLKEIFETKLQSWSIYRKKKWIQGKTTIAFVGEFSAGKTSIVNRILSQDNPNVPQLPVSSKATTAIPTYISGGVNTRYQFVTPNNELKQISESTFKRVNKEVLDKISGVSSLIQYFVMTYDNPNLKNRSILDTPGFNSNDPEDAERTIGVINECDALFWVFDVNAGEVNRSSIKTIKENLTKPLYIVINQIDTKSKGEVDTVEQHISKTLKAEGIKFQKIIRFSKKEPLSVIMQPIQSIVHCDQNEKYLDSLIEQTNNLYNETNTSFKNASNDKRAINSKVQSISDRFSRQLETLESSCKYISDIPQYNSRFWSEDDYRMTKSEHGDMISRLDDISIAQSKELSKTADELKNAAKEYATISEKCEYIKRELNQIGDCLDTLRKKANELKQF